MILFSVFIVIQVILFSKIAFLEMKEKKFWGDLSHYENTSDLYKVHRDLKTQKISAHCKIRVVDFLNF